MLKKIFILFTMVAVLFLVVQSSAQCSNRKLSSYKIGTTYEAAMQKDKPFVLFVYTDWCGYCKKFMPTFLSINVSHSGRYNFVMLNGDDAKYRKLLKELRLEAYPTLYIIDPKYKKRIKLDCYLNESVLQKELNKYLQTRGK